jgi:hypothetical protein
MSSARDALHEAVATLNEAEAARALQWIKKMRGAGQRQILVELLAGDPAIHVPEDPFAPLPSIEPLAGDGIPASELLVRDRR